MKNFMIIFLCLLMSGSLLAQTSNECGMLDNNTPDPAGAYSYSTDPAFLASFPIKVYNIYYWVIKEDDGTGNFSINENKLLESIANLNIAYNQINIFFKYRGFDTINKSEYIVWASPVDFFQTLAYAKFIGKHNPDMLNVYIPREAQGFGGIAEDLISINLGVAAINITRGTFMHEIGHCFNLEHLNSNPGSVTCETVTRDPSIPVNRSRNTNA